MARALSALLLHGAGGGGWEWNIWRGVLEAGGMHVVTPDLLPVRAGIAATQLDDYVEQASEALAHQPGACAVIGASLGGLVAAQLATRATAIVLVNPMPPAPWHAALPAQAPADVIAWRRNARLASTRAALPQADPASALYAFRRWRDEGGAVLREARAGVRMARPSCPVLCITSSQDTDVPAGVTGALAHEWRADQMHLQSGSHVDPLLGVEAAPVAARVLAWLSAR